MEKKYQVFVSSTYEDLKEERDQVIMSILEMGNIPVGMEMFSAADEEQWKTIKRQIDDSDYYVVILGHLYGSVMDNGVSYTEREYDYAVENKIPVLGFVIENSAPWPADKQEQDAAKKKALLAFKKKAKSKLIAFWSNKLDLGSKVSLALMKAINNDPRTGWIRANSVPTAQTANELSRLSAENAILRVELEAARQREAQRGNKVKVVFETLRKNKTRVKVRTTGSWDEATTFDIDLLTVFEAIGPNLHDENTLLGMSQNLALELVGTKYFKQYPIGKNIVSGYAADLAALDLVATSEKKHSVSDKETYWTLSKFGKDVLGQARRLRLESGDSKSADA